LPRKLKSLVLALRKSVPATWECSDFTWRPLGGDVEFIEQAVSDEKVKDIIFSILDNIDEIRSQYIASDAFCLLIPARIVQMNNHKAMTAASKQDNNQDTLSSYNNAWISRANTAIATLHDAFTDPVFIEHVGGTAIAGSRSRPVIDLLLVYDTKKISKEVVCEKLANIGFSFDGTSQLFQSNDGMVSIAMAEFDESVESAEAVMFRDLLRSNPELLESYNSKKAKWSKNYGTDSHTYRENKRSFQKSAIKSIDRGGETFAEYIEKLESDRSVGVVPMRFGDRPHGNDQKLRMCLVHAKEGFWSFPKGHPENKETDIETATRELCEETGIDNARVLTDRTYVDTFTFQDGARSVKKIVKYYPAIVPEEEHYIAEEWEHEISKYRWVSPNDAIDLANFLTTQKIVDWLENENVNEWIGNH